MHSTTLQSGDCQPFEAVDQKVMCDIVEENEVSHNEKTCDGEHSVTVNGLEVLDVLTDSTEREVNISLLSNSTNEKSSTDESDKQNEVSAYDSDEGSAMKNEMPVSLQEVNSHNVSSIHTADSHIPLALHNALDSRTANDVSVTSVFSVLPSRMFPSELGLLTKVQRTALPFSQSLLAASLQKPAFLPAFDRCVCQLKCKISSFKIVSEIRLLHLFLKTKGFWEHLV